MMYLRQNIKHITPTQYQRLSHLQSRFLFKFRRPVCIVTLEYYAIVVSQQQEGWSLKSFSNRLPLLVPQGMLMLKVGDAHLLYKFTLYSLSY